MLLFVVRPRGAQLTTLHVHHPDPGYYCSRPVIDAAGNLYSATASSRGPSVFTVKADGTGLRVLAHVPSWGSLVLAESRTLYGTAFGDAFRRGSLLYALETDGTSYRVLHAFEGGPNDGEGAGTPLAMDASGRIFGTTCGGGASGSGVIFSMDRDGADFRVLHSFTPEFGDLSHAKSGVVVDHAGNLYGTTQTGGVSGRGTVYTMRADGSGFSILHSFSGDDGAEPTAELRFKRGGPTERRPKEVRPARGSSSG